MSNANANTNHADIFSKTTYHYAASRMVDSGETASAGTVMKISAKMNNKR
jgi:hypothetical protein